MHWMEDLSTEQRSLVVALKAVDKEDAWHYVTLCDKKILAELTIALSYILDSYWRQLAATKAKAIDKCFPPDSAYRNE